MTWVNYGMKTILIIADTCKQKEEKKSYWVLDMGCLFSYFFRPSIDVDIIEPPKQVFSW